MAIPFTLSTGSASITASEFFLVSASTSPVYQTTPGKVSGLLDLSAMIAGDMYQVTPYEKVNGGSELPAAPPSFPSGVQSSHFVIPERWVNVSWEIGVKLITGSARTIGWSVKIDVGDRNATNAPSAATIASTLLATALEGSKTVAQVLRGMFRLTTAKKSGYDTGTVKVRDAADTKDSMTLVTDATGVTSVTYTDLT